MGDWVFYGCPKARNPLKFALYQTSANLKICIFLKPIKLLCTHWVIIKIGALFSFQPKISFLPMSAQLITGFSSF